MVNNQEQAIQIKELMETLVEAVPEMMRLLQKSSLEEFYLLANDFKMALFQIKSVSDKETEELYKEISDIVINCQSSMDSLMLYVKYNREKALQKLEFELWPFVRIMHIHFYFMALIYPDQEKMNAWYAGEGQQLCKNYYVEEAERTGHYKYDVSILVTAYNKLEYTKMCVMNILKNLPKNIKCELILRNHGSTDGTKEYFEKICPTKQIDYAVNRAGSKSIWFTYEGKYVFLVSNDVLITPNMIEILYEAFEENEDYGFAVPVTPNISNLQIPLPLNNGSDNGGIPRYENMQEFEKFAMTLNKRDKRKEEVRFRLCDPLAFLRNKCANLTDRYSLLSIELTQNTNSMFPDDLRSMYMRRAGYKNVLMKDLYAHHFGSITIKNENLQVKDYSKGRRNFLNNNGIDPWGKGFCWTWELFDKLLCNKADSKRILGINCGMGSNLLKIQQEIKENTGNDFVKTVAMTDNQRYIQDLLALTDEVLLHNGWEDITNSITEMYDYIIVDEKIEIADYRKNIEVLYDHVVEHGMLIVYVPDVYENIKKWIKSRYENVVVTESNEIIYEIDTVVSADMPKRGCYLYWEKK